jgi:hypothetical protein
LTEERVIVRDDETDWHPRVVVKNENARNRRRRSRAPNLEKTHRALKKTRNRRRRSRAPTLKQTRNPSARTDQWVARSAARSR